MSAPPLTTLESGNSGFQPQRTSSPSATTSPIEELFGRMPGLGVANQYFEGHQRIRDYRDGVIEEDGLRHVVESTRERLRRNRNFACQPPAATIPGLDLCCVDIRKAAIFDTSDLPQGMIMRKTNPGPALVPILALNTLVRSFDYQLVMFSGHSQCKALDLALKTFHHSPEPGDPEPDPLALSIIAKIEANLNGRRPEVKDLVQNLHRIGEVPHLQDLYAELNQKWMVEQLRYLLENSEEYRTRVEYGRLVVISTFEDIREQYMFINPESLAVNKPLRDDPGALELAMNHFARYAYIPKAAAKRLHT